MIAHISTHRQVVHFFKLWLNRGKSFVEDYMRIYAPLEWQDEEALSALLALADSTEAARDERYPASNWKVTQ